jgi:predicted MFS family arabinose efflux permease
MWTIGITLTMEFGSEAERPTYIGMAYTLVVPASAVAPLFGGWLADQYGYPATFLATTLFGVLTLFVYLFWVKSPRGVEKNPLIPALEITPRLDE